MYLSLQRQESFIYPWRVRTHVKLTACLPGAHRAHIALEELNLPFEEVIIDLDRPRDSWYLQINPRGLVPTLSVDGQIITESGIVSQFLADAYPSHLVPPSDASGGALRRAGIAFFADAFISKVQNWLFKVVNAKTEADQEAISDAVVAAVVQEVEPLLKTAGPFFDGSDKLTLAEVCKTLFFFQLGDECFGDDPG